MPTRKPPTDPSGKKPRRSGARSKTDLHPSLAHLKTISIAGADDPDGLSPELSSDSLNYLIYRTGPKDITQGKRVYLTKTWEPPDAESIKKQFGGGEFYIHVQEGGRITKGSARIVIEGEPIVQSDNQADLKLSELPASSDPVVNALVRQFENVTERLLAEIQDLKAQRSGSSGGGFDPDNFQRMIDIARRARYEDYAMKIGLGSEQSEAPTLTEDVINQRISAYMDMFSKGIEIGSGKEPTESNPLMELLAPMIASVIQKNQIPTAAQVPSALDKPAGGTASPGQGEPTRSGSPYDIEIEKQRTELEEKTVEMKLEALAGKLVNAIRVMLDALEAEIQYTNLQVIGFIHKEISEPEIQIVKDRLTFDNVRMLMQQTPGDQISLDNNRERVESILSDLQKTL